MSTQNKHTPGSIGVSYTAYVDENGEGFLSRAVYDNATCGCRVIGNGSLQHPLTVQHCPLHKSAPDLLAALEVTLERLDHYTQNIEATDLPRRRRVSISPRRTLESEGRMKTNRINKIRNLWRKWGHLNSSPAGWMSDDELEKIAKRIPKRITGKRFVTDAILEKP